MPVNTITTEAVEEQVKQIIIDVLGVSRESVTPDVSLDELGADSLYKIDIVMALEEKFGVEISEENAAQCQTLRAITAMIMKRTGKL